MKSCFFIGHRDAPQDIFPLLINTVERSVPLPPGFDSSFYPPGMETVPRRFAILRANRYMVDHADFLIAYAWHPASNARNLVEYALGKGIPTVNLGDFRN